MNEKICENCKYFIQHYRKAKKNYYEVHFGHCVCLRVKACKPDKTCGNWKPLNPVV